MDFIKLCLLGLLTGSALYISAISGYAFVSFMISAKKDIHEINFHLAAIEQRTNK